jgi:hypothetical protein
MQDRMIDFNITVAGKKEQCLLPVSMILCLFPERRQIRTVENGWTLEVAEEDWNKVETAFSTAYKRHVGPVEFYIERAGEK